jgi:hypothetical protein
VVVTDPGRGNSARFTRFMQAQGYEHEQSRCAMNDEDKPPYRGRLLKYRRDAARVATCPAWR